NKKITNPNLTRGVNGKLGYNPINRNNVKVPM
ncbi:unnamed protein product, partial [marine sediment metagenome]